MNQHRTHRTALASATACLALLAGCTGAVPDRAGGTVGATPLMLDMAVGNDGAPPQLAAWAEEVKTRSKGTVTINFITNYGAGSTDFETTAFRDVVTGKIATASLGARALDRVGVTSFQGLLAPMLVDSYDLEAKVFGSGVPEQMLKGVEGSGAVGLAILPGPMRKVLGINKPFLAPSDFAGARIGDQDSALTEQALRALGATAVPEPSGAKLAGLDGYEQQLSSIEGNGYVETGAKYTTANLNLWPRPIVVVIGSAAYGGLTPSQRSVLHDAAKTTLSRTIDLSRAEDTGALESLCRTGMQLPVATPDQLDTLRATFEPTYVSLAKTAATKDWVSRIQQLKDELKAAPETVSCPGGTGTDNTPIEGTYKELVTPAADLRASCPAGDIQGSLPPENQVDYLSVVFDGGTVTQYQTTAGGGREVGWHGTYQVFRDTLQLTSGNDVLTMTWRLSGQTLRLSNLRNSHDCRDAMVWALHPWHRVSH